MRRQLDAYTTPLEEYDLEPGDLVAGSPVASEITTTTVGDAKFGIWQITPGIVTDVEKDEAFVVLTGEGTITFADGEVVELVPGSLVRLYAEESTTWEIRSTLRKVYVI